MILHSIVPSKSICLCLLTAAGLSACQKRIADPIEQPLPVGVTNSPLVASIHTTVIRQEDLWVELIELGGQEIINDIILEHALKSELQKQGFSISPTDIQYEETLLVSVTEIDERAVEKILNEKGIGPVRKSKLLWRNAALRKLVGPIDIHEEEILRMYSIVHGPKYPLQILVVTTLSEATRAKERIENGELFTNVALEMSIDPSAKHGGIVHPISIADPAWPAPIRETLSSLQPQTITDPIFIGDRWVICTTSGIRIEPSMSFSETKNEMERLARIAQERFKMEIIAGKLLQTAQVKIFDRDLQKLSSPNR